eukprot:6214225-Pleurochrysis_carterae.AAC.1
MNGIVVVEFPLQSGVAQGDPISPPLFLLVGEAITRTIVEDPYCRSPEAYILVRGAFTLPYLTHEE